MKSRTRSPRMGRGAPMPHGVRPMLATLVDRPFDREGWIFEIKWDGFRAIAEVDRQIHLYSRNLLPFNDRFPTIVHALKSLKKRCVLDGEIVVLDTKGLPNFQHLQNYHRDEKGTLAYYAFDLLYLDGRDLRNERLADRKSELRKLLSRKKTLRYSDHVAKRGIEFFNAAAQKNLEGIIGKDIESVYRSGVRSRAWTKMKTVLRQEAVIAGYTAPKGSRKDIGSLVLAVYDDRQLVYIGQSGGGFSEDELSEMRERLRPLERTTVPFKSPPPGLASATWVEPRLVCEVNFREWTASGQMRHPVFVGMREDKAAKEVSREIPARSP